MTQKQNKSLEEHVRSQPRQRTFLIRSAQVNEENNTVEVAFSSEEPVLRCDWYGELYYEVLDHSEGAVDLSRLNNAGAVLVDHNLSIQVGVVESARTDNDRINRAIAKYSKNNPRAVQELQDIRDGIRQHISVGYQINNLVRDPDPSGDGIPIYRAINWTPYEISTVAVPADTTVGVGRSLIEPSNETETQDETVQEEPQALNDSSPTQTEENRSMPPSEDSTQSPSVDAAQVRSKAIEDLRNEVNEIIAIGTKFELREFADQAIKDGMSLETFRSAVLDKMGKPKITKVPDNAAEIGLTNKEVRDYSIMKAIRAQWTTHPDYKRFQEDAGLELEASKAVSQKLDREAKGILIPHDALRRPGTAMLEHNRTLSVGTATAGGNLVATNLESSSFIDILRNKAMVVQMGAKMLSGLVGNVAIPRQSSASTAYWISTEGNDPSASQPAFDQVSLSPKTVGTYTDLTRNLLMQSSLDVEALIRDDLAQVLALGIDFASVLGTGTGGMPKGILNYSGIGAISGGTNGAIPSWSNIVGLETLVSTANADVGSLGYLTNPTTRGTLKVTPKVAGYPVFVWDGEQMNGYKTGVTTQLPNNLTKGSASNCSPIIYGNWSDLLIGEWGVLDLMVNPYVLSNSGGVRVNALQSVDIALRHLVSFAAMVDALPAP